jgi:hypothetical protein
MTNRDHLLRSSDDLNYDRRQNLKKIVEPTTLQKLMPKVPLKAELLKRGLARETAHYLDSLELQKRHDNQLDAVAKRDALLGHVDATHSKIILGDASTEHGLIQVAIDLSTDSLNLQGHDHSLAEINERLRAAIYSCASSFNEAQSELAWISTE